MTKRKSREDGRLTINVGKVISDSTSLRISKRAALESREFTEDVFLPMLIGIAGRCAEQEGIKTIEERHYLRAKDWIVSTLHSGGLL